MAPKGLDRTLCFVLTFLVRGNALNSNELTTKELKQSVGTFVIEDLKLKMMPKRSKEVIRFSVGFEEGRLSARRQEFSMDVGLIL